jgi:hypothetical protein
MRYILIFFLLLQSLICFSQFKGKTEKFKFGSKSQQTGKFVWEDWTRIDPITVYITPDSVIINSLTKQVYYVDKINDNLKSGEAMVLDCHDSKNEKGRIFLFTDDDFDTKFLIVQLKNNSWMYELY